MSEKVLLYLFIFCVILAQVIVGTFLEEGNEQSSSLLVRQKRVIDRRPGKDTPLRNGDLPYIASLKKYNIMHCVATILSHHNAITAARCFESSDIRLFTVHSGTAYSSRGNAHNITEMKMHGHNPSRSSTFMTGVALITVRPSFAYGSNTGSIRLHSEPVLAGMQGTVAGWGHRAGTGRIGTQYPQRLRLISVPIMNHRKCLDIFHGHFPITDEDICTYDPQKACGSTDSGAPLVIDNELVGVHIGEIIATQDTAYCTNEPDVFVLLQHLNYGRWIMNNIVP